MTEKSKKSLVTASSEEWLTYDDWAPGIDGYRLPSTDLAGQSVAIEFTDGPTIKLEFEKGGTASWTGDGAFAGSASDPYDAVAVRRDVMFLNLPFTSRDREALTIIYSTRTGRAIGVHSVIQPERLDDVPQVTQEFWAGVVLGGKPGGAAPGPSRDLIGRRSVYRYSPEHLYEHVYMSSERYMWQCLEGVQRGHGDVELSTVWKFDDELYLFCFREFKISVATVWLHDLGFALRTTGIFLGLNEAGEPEHSRAGGHIYPLGAVSYPNVQPI